MKDILNYFTIGEAYEKNEFNLESIESTFNNGLEYENYEYLKEDFNMLFEVEFSSNIILQYNADILYRVIYIFDTTHYNYLKSKVKEYSNDDIIFEVYIKDKNNCKLVVKKR